MDDPIARLVNLVFIEAWPVGPIVVAIVVFIAILDVLALIFRPRETPAEQWSRLASMEYDQASRCSDPLWAQYHRDQAASHQATALRCLLREQQQNQGQ